MLGVSNSGARNTAMKQEREKGGCGLIGNMLGGQVCIKISPSVMALGLPGKPTNRQTGITNKLQAGSLRFKIVLAFLIASLLEAEAVVYSVVRGPCNYVKLSRSDCTWVSRRRLDAHSWLSPTEWIWSIL